MATVTLPGWAPSRPRRPPEPADVHVWWLELCAGPGSAPADLLLLSAEERARAAGFVFDVHRARFVSARAGLRRLLGAYLSRPPAQLRFEYGSAGKPRLAGADQTLEFNLTHSKDLALVAVASSRSVGVDLECVRPVADAQAIAKRFFSPPEAEALLRLPPSARDLAFFRIWTRKEALLKASGQGIAGGGLGAIDVGHDLEGPAVMTHLPGDADDVSPWTLVELEVCGDIAAALAVRGPLLRILRQRWDEHA